MADIAVSPSYSIGTRPLGVSIIAVIYIIGSIYSVLNSITSLTVITLPYDLWLVIIGIIKIIVGYHLWNMRVWARKAVIVLELMDMASSSFILMAHPLLIYIPLEFKLAALIPMIFISLIIIGYLMQSRIIQAFENAETPKVSMSV